MEENKAGPQSRVLIGGPRTAAQLKTLVRLTSLDRTVRVQTKGPETTGQAKAAVKSSEVHHTN